MIGPENTQKKQPKNNKIKNILSLAVLAIAFYILLSPFIPNMTYHLGKIGLNDITTNTFGNLQETRSELRSKEVEQEVYLVENDSEVLIEELEPEIIPEEVKPIPQENMLIIPKIGVDGLIHEGESTTTLNKGIWRRPFSSNPEDGSNTVLLAHRFMYTSGPNTFYHLDKLEIGDQFQIFWEGEEFNYEVFETSVVKPTEVAIEAPTEEDIVTLYTCTPIWTSKNRLVVKAKPIEL